MAAIAEVAAPAAQIVLLVKPQFEVGQKGRLGKNGIVTDPSLREQALERVERCAREHGLQVVASAPLRSKAPMAMPNIFSICVCRNRRDSICCVMEYKTWRASAVRDSCEELGRHLLTGICFDER